MTAYFFIGHGHNWGKNLSSKEGNREFRLAEAVLAGFSRHGINSQGIPKTSEPVLPDDCTILCFFGVKGAHIRQAAEAHGIPWLYFDKPYLLYPRVHAKPSRTRTPKSHTYWRVSICAHNPTEWLATDRHTTERWDKLLSLSDLDYHVGWRDNGPEAPVIFAGSSEKYHIFHGLPHPTAYAEQKIAELRAITGRPVLYRPKPSWRGATPIPDTANAGGRLIAPHLESAHALVTHGSGACFDALVAGVPGIVLGEGVTKPISSTSIKEVDRPRRASEVERRQLLANLAWWQFELSEIRSGWMFDVLRAKLPECVA